MKANELLHKGYKAVAQWARRNGYVVACDYEEGENTGVEFSKVAAGVTVKSLTVVFNNKWRAIDVR